MRDFSESAPPKEIREFISYDKETGEFTSIKRRQGIKLGGRADRYEGGSALRYRLVFFHGRGYLAHRLAWYFETGEWPSVLIDHRNRDKGDNRFSNLRPATVSQNAMNSEIASRLPRGVTLHRQTNKYQAQIGHEGKNLYLGLFDTPSEAHAAYAREAVARFGEFVVAS